MKILIPFLILLVNEAIAQTKNLISNTDSLNYYKEQLTFSSSQNELNSKCNEIVKYIGGYDFILDNIEVQDRTSVMHTYFPGYLNYILTNLDDKMERLLKDRIENNEIQVYCLVHILPRLSMEKQEICSYVDSLMSISFINEKDPLSLHQRLKRVKSAKSYIAFEICK